MTTWEQHAKLCYAIAKDAHAGQHRRGGELYINHPGRVARQFDANTIEASIAYLHDVIEDTDETAATLAANGVDDEVIARVELLTKRDGQGHWDYLTEVKKDQIARTVKIADMLDNLCDRPTEKQRDKYRDGIMWLAT